VREDRLAQKLLEAHQRKDSPTRLDIAAHCFEAQRPFVLSQAKFRVADCSRRAGKTEGEAAVLFKAAEEHPGCVGLYITKTLKNAKRIMWGALKRVNRERQLGGEAKEAEVRMEMPNGFNIYLSGANHKDEIDKFRGMPLVVVIIDEAQLLTDLRVLIDEVLAPALMDYDGKVVLGGTPGPVPVGYFYECTKNKEWAHYSWTVFDNPWIQKKSGKSPQEHLEAECKRRGVTKDDPSIQREWFGRWVYDPNSLVFRYEAVRNHFDSLPDMRGELCTVVAGDLGWDDADALAVLLWNTARPDLWLIHEDVMPKQSITTFGNKLKALVDKHQPMDVVLDFGGLGKKIADELTQRWGLRVNAAEKERKLEHIELLNDAMRTGVFHAKKDSRFAQDAMLVEWDKTNPEKPKISERFHSDICDAVLYGYRRALHWLPRPEAEVRPKVGTEEWHARQMELARKQLDAEIEAELEALAQRKRERMEEEEEVGWL